VTPEKRLEALRKLVAEKPGDPFARYSLAMTYRTSGRSEEAVAEFQEIARLHPDYLPTYLMLGQALEALGRAPEAVRVYEAGMAVASRTGEQHARQKLGEALESLRAQGV